MKIPKHLLFRFPSFFLLLTVFLQPQFRSRADYTATLNPGTTWGTWEGWGCSLAWWAKSLGTHTDLCDIVWTRNYTTITNSGQTLPGLGMNIVRYNAGACSWNGINGGYMQVSPNIPSYRQMEGYWTNWFSTDPNSTSWTWWVDSNQRNAMWNARNRGADKFELFSNSPMWWMCYNHNPSGADSGSSDNLQSWNYDQHAIYLATIAKYCRDNWGITFNSIEAFNEPVANWWTSTGSQEGCHFAQSTQATVIGYLRSELNSRGLISALVATSDENTYDQETADLNYFTPTTVGQIGRVNVHGYQYGGGRRDLLYNKAQSLGLGIWNTEYGDGDASGMSLASNLNLDFRWLHNTAWCYWQPFDWSGWGLVQCNLPDWVGPANMKYFVLCQYSRHIREGMTIIDGGNGNVIAAYNPSSHLLVIVCANYGTAQWINFDLSRFTTVSGPITRWCTNTGGGDQYAQHNDTNFSGKLFWSWFATNTIQTFEVQNVTP